jgi:2'-5' RNA ligase
MENHWNRPGWSDGQSSFHFFIDLGDVREIRELAESCQQNLAHIATLDMVKSDSLHMTLQRLAFTYEISRAAAIAVGETLLAKLRDFPAPTVIVGPLAGSQGAVRFSVGPHEPLLEIRAATRSAIAEHLGPNAASLNNEARFIPHVSIAYHNARAAAGALVDHVEPLRRLGSASVTIPSISLVELKRVGHCYDWKNLMNLPLDCQ